MNKIEITREIAAKVLTTVDAGLCLGLGDPVPGEMCVEAAVCYALGLPHGDDPKCVSEAVRSLKVSLNDKDWSSNKSRAKGLRRLALAQLGSLGAVDDKDFSRRVAEYTIRTMVPIALRAAASLQKEAKHRRALTDAATRCEAEVTSAAATAAVTAATDATDAAHASHAAANAANAAAHAANAAAHAAHAAANVAVYVAYNAVAHAVHAAHAVGTAAAATAAATNNVERDKILSQFAEGIVQILVEMDAPGCQWLDMTEA